MQKTHVSRWTTPVLFALALLMSRSALATDYHVATTGSDEAAGTSEAPWLTLQKAADVMMAGDTCTVHAGTYREWIDPPRGGTSNDARIVYQAAEGEQVFLKGSDAVTAWTQDGSTWTTVIPNTTFGDFNPYTATITGDYLNYGSEYHLGEVFLNGQALSEVLSAGELSGANTWYATVDGTNTTISANFGAADPTQDLAEVTVRKYVIFPSEAQLGFITFRGFYVSHAATNWAPPTAHPQEGMISMNFGFSWIIENNHITDGKTVCVCGGVGTGGSQDIDKVGSHIIRNNTIQRCGQAGIAGSHGLPASTIEGNLIEDINPSGHFGGYESAGIKIHSAIDVVIKNNIIRQVHGGNGSFPGIWIDWQGQGSRLTGNVIYDIEQAALELEMDHGPTLLDNNIFVGHGGSTIWDLSENSIFVHNLFVDTSIDFSQTDGRVASYFEAHTTSAAGQAAHNSADDRIYNNIYVNNGTGNVPQWPGYLCDYNVIYGANGSKSSWADANSIVNTGFDAAFSITTTEHGVTVSWNADTAPTDIAAPLITKDFIGTGTLTGLGIESHDGSPITVDTDITGAARDGTHPTAGPLEMSMATNQLTIEAGADGENATSGGSSAGGSSSAAGGSDAAGGSANASGGSAVTSGGSGVSTGGASVTASSGGAGTSGATGSNKSDDPAGCGCRVVDAASARSNLWLVALALGAVGLRKRARRAA